MFYQCEAAAGVAALKSYEVFYAQRIRTTDLCAYGRIQNYMYSVASNIAQVIISLVE